MKRVLIVGAGLGGLSLGYRLLGRAEVVLIDPATRAGGNLRTTTPAEGFRLEWGPNGFLDSKPNLWTLCQDLGLGSELIAASEGSRKFRFVCHRGRIMALPGSPGQLLRSELLSLRGKLTLLAEPFRPRGRVNDQESVTVAATRRLGREAATILMEALVTGIHAADPERLSLRAAFPKLFDWEQQHGSWLRGFLAQAKARKAQAASRGESPNPQRMWSFRQGLQRLIDRLSEILEPQLRLQTSLVHWQRDAQGCYQVQFSQGPPQLFDAVVLACPAPEQARLLRMIPGAPAVEFEKIPYTAISVVGLGYRQIDTPQVPEGFGYIAASRQRRDVIGVQWCSSIFPDRAPAGHVLWRALVGGAGRPEAAAWDDATLVTKVHEEMQQLLGVRGRPVFQEIIRWPQAIPQYHLGHPERVARIEQALSQLPGLYSAGNSLHGVAMNDVVEQSDCLAARILAASAPV